MSGPSLQRVFPERNRSALEGSPERLALEQGRKDIATTTGHIATKFLAVLVEEGIEEKEALRAVLDIFPTARHNDPINTSFNDVGFLTCATILDALFVAPIREQRDAYAKRMTEKIQAYCEGKHFIALRTLEHWLASSVAHDMKAKTDCVKNILDNLYDMVSECEPVDDKDTGRNEDNYCYPFPAEDVLKQLPDLITEAVFSPTIMEATDLQHRVYRKFQGLFSVTCEVRKRLEAMYPIQPGN